MQERELLESCFDETIENENQRKKKYFVWLVLGILGGGFYLLILLFGNSSWSVLSNLKKEKMQLESEVLRLQNENVDLQKIIFELKGLEPANSEE